MAKRMKLGKGMASLLQNTAVVEEAKKKVELEDKKMAAAPVAEGPMLVDVNQIIANPGQPRKIFKQKELEELSQSIKENGIIQPLIVAKADNGFELIAGERRLRASKLAGLEKVPVVLKRATEKERMVMAILENVQRSDLNCIEEALAYFQLMDDYGLTQEEVAKKLGKERSSIANFLRILKLPRAVVDMLHKDLLTFGHGKVLASVKEKELAERLANQALTEELSVRELEKLIKASSKKKNAKSTEPSESLKEFFDTYRQKLESKTGFQIKIAGKKNGAGQISFNFSNEAEFNDIYSFLVNNTH
jgi:ParB family chromosome partitioning protein